MMAMAASAGPFLTIFVVAAAVALAVDNSPLDSDSALLAGVDYMSAGGLALGETEVACLSNDGNHCLCPARAPDYPDSSGRCQRCHQCDQLRCCVSCFHHRYILLSDS